MTNFNKILECIKGKKVYIQTHNYPDPDAIASAYGVQVLLRNKGIPAVICYKGDIDRSNTIKMLDLLKIDIVNINLIEKMTMEDEIILVDAQKGNSNIMDIPGDEFICIDHHPTYETIQYTYSDIRPEVGSCASIVAEYFFENDMTPDKYTATALMYGIKIDTANISRGVSDLDLEMFYKLYKLCDHNIINQLELNTLQFDDLHAFANAINSIKVYNNLSFANTGKDCHEALIATVSDFVLDLNEVEVSVVYSIKKDGIKLSVRTDGTYDAGELTKQALAGIGDGGGHERMAGGFVPTCEENKKVKTDYMLLGELENRFMDILSKADKRPMHYKNIV